MSASDAELDTIVSFETSPRRELLNHLDICFFFIFVENQMARLWLKWPGKNRNASRLRILVLDFNSKRAFHFMKECVNFVCVPSYDVLHTYSLKRLS